MYGRSRLHLEAVKNMSVSLGDKHTHVLLLDWSFWRGFQVNQIFSYLCRGLMATYALACKSVQAAHERLHRRENWMSDVIQDEIPEHHAHLTVNIKSSSALTKAPCGLWGRCTKPSD